MPKAKKTAKKAPAAKAPATRASARVAAAAPAPPTPTPNYYPHAAYHQPPAPPAPAVPANPAYYPNAVYAAPPPALYNAPPHPYHAPPPPPAPGVPMVVMQGPGGQPMYLDARAFEQAYAHFAAALPPPGYALPPPGQYALPPSHFAPPQPAPGTQPALVPAPGAPVAFGQHALPPSRFAPAPAPGSLPPPAPGPQVAFGQPTQIGHAQLPPPVHYPRAAAQQVVAAPAVRAAIAKAAAATKSKKAAPPPAPAPARPVASTSTPGPAPAPAPPRPAMPPALAASTSTPQRAPTPSSSQVRLPKLPSVGQPPVTPAPSSSQVRLPMLPSPAPPAPSTQATASSGQQPARDDDGWNVVYADWYFQSATEQLLQPCASCGVFFDDEALDHGERIPGAQTGPRAQLIAIVRALEIARVNDGPLRIKTASDYAVKAIRDWLPGFARNGWRTQAGAPVQNKALLQYVAALLDFRGVVGQRVELAHVPGEPTRPRDVEGFQNAQYLAQEASTNQPSVSEPDWDALRAAVEKRGEALLKSGGGVPLRASNVGAGASLAAPEKKPSTVVWAKPKPEPGVPDKDKENAQAATPLGKGGRSMLESAARALERRNEPVDVIEIDDDDDNFELSAAQLAALDEIEAVYSQSSQPRAAA